MQLKIQWYDQKGNGVARVDNKSYPIPGTILNEVVEVDDHFNLLAIVEPSPNRREEMEGVDYSLGGYELLHMNKQAQIEYKEYVIKDRFRMNANYDIKLEPMVYGEEFRYRNKITLHDGGFYAKGTHKVVEVNDFLLTSIKPRTALKGEVIFRQLDTLIVGNKGEKLFTTDTLLGLKFRVSLSSFYQVNKEIAEKAYSLIVENIDKGSSVLDLYSGIGTISLLASQVAEKVVAVEYNTYSHKDAKYNAKMNGITNVRFVNENVSKYLNVSPHKFDTVILDPAREGAAKYALKLLMKKEPKKIIYLSCDPSTQARDFRLLQQKYKITKAIPIDMFPQTYHIENLLVLELM